MAFGIAEENGFMLIYLRVGAGRRSRFASAGIAAAAVMMPDG